MTCSWKEYDEITALGSMLECRKSDWPREEWEVDLFAREGFQVGTIMCGDMNAQSYDLSMKFLLSGWLDASHGEWATSSLFRWESKANAEPPADVTNMLCTKVE